MPASGACRRRRGARARQAPADACAARRRHASSRWRWCCWRTAAGGEVFYTASIADVSERHDAARQIERQREALRQSEKLDAMGSLLAGVAHELNNPLAIVMGRASLLEEKCEDQPALKADAARIREAAERCGRIVRTFLDMARNRPSRRSRCAQRDGARRRGDAALRLPDARHRARPRARRRPADVQADADQIGQVVMNLLVNAQQALAGFDGVRRVRVETASARPRRARAARLAARRRQRPGVDEAARARSSSPSSPPRPKARHRPRPRGVALAGARPRRRRRPRAARREGGASFRSACRSSPPRRHAAARERRRAPRRRRRASSSSTTRPTSPR
jgi:two-component system NtrC family sensor kinase